MKAVVRGYSARVMTKSERALVAEWIARAGDIGEAYVSSRRSDDPTIYHRIVVVTKPEEGPSHLIHAPCGRNNWIVFSLGRQTKVQRFRTLRTALNSVRPVLVETRVENAPRIPKLA